MKDLTPPTTKTLKVPCTLEVVEENGIPLSASLSSDMPNYAAKYVHPMARALKNAALLMEAATQLMDKLEAAGDLMDAEGNPLPLNQDATEEKKALRNVLKHLKGEN